MWRLQEGFSEEAALAPVLQESWAGGRAKGGHAVVGAAGARAPASPLPPRLSPPPALLVPSFPAPLPPPPPPPHHSALGHALPQQVLASGLATKLWKHLVHSPEECPAPARLLQDRCVALCPNTESLSPGQPVVVESVATPRLVAG